MKQGIAKVNGSKMVFYNLKNTGVVSSTLKPELALDSVQHHAFSILRDPNVSLFPSMDLYNPYPC